LALLHAVADVHEELGDGAVGLGTDRGLALGDDPPGDADQAVVESIPGRHDPYAESDLTGFGRQADLAAGAVAGGQGEEWEEEQAAHRVHPSWPSNGRSKIPNGRYSQASVGVNMPSAE